MLRATIATTSLLAAVGCALVLLLGITGSDTVAQGTSEESPASSFALLRESTTSPPPPEVLKAAKHAPMLFGLDPQGARRSRSSGAWLIPGAGELCIAVEDSEGLGMSCAPLEEAKQGHLTFLERSADGGPNTLIGAAPDGMSNAAGHNADGDVLAGAPVQESTYVVEANGLTGATLSP